MKAAARIAAWIAFATFGCTAHAAAVQATDDAGTVVKLANPAQRIVSLAPHLTEQLYSAGAGNRIVGVDVHSDFPPPARWIQRVGDATQLDLERIVTLKPDLIVVWHHGNSPQQIKRLQKLKIPIYASEARKLEDIASTLRRLGLLAGTLGEADAAAKRYESEIDALRRQYASRRNVRVFYQVWHQPLMTLNGTHLVNHALTLCGASNVFAQLEPLTPTVTEEAVVQADPEAILTGSVDPAGPDNLDVWRRLLNMRATRAGNLLVLNPDLLHRQSVRMAQGIGELCAKLDTVRAKGSPAGGAPGIPPGSPLGVNMGSSIGNPPMALPGSGR